MANLQIKNIPPDLYEVLCRRATQQHMTVSAYALQVPRRELAVLTQDEWFAVLEQRPSVDLGDEVVRALDAARAERDEDLSTGFD